MTSSSEGYYKRIQFLIATIKESSMGVYAREIETNNSYYSTSMFKSITAKIVFIRDKRLSLSDFYLLMLLRYFRG